jgi:hypothetical protein
VHLPAVITQPNLPGSRPKTDLASFARNLHVKATEIRTDEDYVGAGVGSVCLECFEIFSITQITKPYPPRLLIFGVRGSLVGLGTLLQAARSQVRVPIWSLDLYYG